MDIYFDRIKPLFDATGFSVQKLAKEIGISANDIYHWNKNGYKTYTKYYYQIAKYFGVSVEYLMGETDDPAPSVSSVANMGGLSDVQKSLIASVTKMTDAEAAAMYALAKTLEAGRQRTGDA